MSKDDKILKEFTSKEYEHGWSVDFDVDQAPIGLNAVSYTHLTLPTILLV